MNRPTPIDDGSFREDERLGRLAASAARGDRDAAAGLLRGVQDAVYRFALAQLGCREAAADAAQETARRLLTAVRTRRGDSRVTTWALGVTRNVCREHRRRQARRSAAGEATAQLAELPSRESPVGSRVEQDEQAARLRAAIATLPERQREAVVLRHLECLSVAETASVMGCSEGTVKASHWQAIRRLRTELAADTQDEPTERREPVP
ncbi:MAG: sigma-70 family RNA polymerase sigma factor [Planctomycetota bacterium]